MSEKTLPEAGRAFVFRTPEGRKGASGTIWGKILCAEGQTGGKQVYPLSRREAKKLIPVYMMQRKADSGPLSTGCFLLGVGFVLGRFIHRPAV